MTLDQQRAVVHTNPNDPDESRGLTGTNLVVLTGTATDKDGDHAAAPLSKLLVLPVYPAAWPQAKKHRFVQLVFKSYETIKCLYVIKKVGFRYRQAEIAGIAAVERLERTTGLASAVRWLRKAHVAKHFGV